MNSHPSTSFDTSERAETPPPPCGLNMDEAPPSLWSRQPNEPAPDYQLFAAWLQLPAPRSLPKAALPLGCSVHRLRQLSARYNWKTRATAFDNYRADATSRALDELLRQETKDWRERAHNFRLQEWLLHEQMLDSALAALRKFERYPGRASLTDIAKLLDLASILGRRACGMPLNPSDAPPAPTPDPFRAEVEAALRKVYG